MQYKEQKMKNNSPIHLTIVWRTRNTETIRKIREKFNLPPGMTINRETTAFVSPEEMELLREVERRGFIGIRFKRVSENETG